MKIKIENLGITKFAEVQLSELNIIYGNNNTGKSYITHTIFGFLDFLKLNFNICKNIEWQMIDKLIKERNITVDIKSHILKLQSYMDDVSKDYTKNMHNVLKWEAKRLKSFDIKAILESTDKWHEYFRTDRIELPYLKIMRSDENDDLLNVIFDVKNFDDSFSAIEDLTSIFHDSLSDLSVEGTVPRPFIVSSERSNILSFYDRREIIPLHESFPLAVRKNINFINEIQNNMRQESFIKREHPEILDFFEELLGGKYIVDEKDGIQFLPKFGMGKKIDINESSTMVKSLFIVEFYLRHTAQKGDLLIIDEPELNLHPENQRKMARLFVRLINVGVKVFITTHSDYIIKELNTLIMLNQKEIRLRDLAEREGYDTSELLDPDKVRVYLAKEDFVKIKQGQRKTRCHTLVHEEVDKQFGIAARNFDTVIDDMNRIQDEIIWGE